jgi:nucleoside-diphosphate-sugar epimerase
MKSVKKGFQLLIGFKKKFLNLIYVDDLIDGIVEAALKDRAEDEIYFLGSRTAYPNEDIGNTIAAIVERKPLNIHLPHCIIFGICGCGELVGKISGKEMYLNLQKARELIQNSWSCSIEKARTHLNFNPQTALYQGFLNTFLWYKKMGWI